MNFLHKLDPAQRQATDPKALIWVNANAGTGKTTVLTNRVLRLLLAGTNPAKILCLTYTKAAASEMQNRIIERLRHWVTLDEAALKIDILTLTEISPSDATLKRARGLFIEVLEHAEGMNVQTIHAFAQSILRRFPVEAGVSPYFRIMDEQEAVIILEQALQMMLQRLHAGQLPELEDAAKWALKEASDASLKKILQNALAESTKWRSLVNLPRGLTQFKAMLTSMLDIAEDHSEEKLLQAFCACTESHTNDIKTVIAIIEQAGYSQQYMLKLKEALRARLGGLQNAQLDSYINAFLTNDYTPRKGLEKFDQHETLSAFLQQEIPRVRGFVLQRAKLRALRKTLSYYALIETIFIFYRHLTNKLGVLDYQQLLTQAEQLLTSASKSSGWVMYKMDGGLEHILVDEAQDTSPEQWLLIKALADEFFTGDAQAKTVRTLFIVGDEKQSIYSFQGADVREFKKMKDWFEERVQHSMRQLNTVMLEKSYRSAQTVIHAINASATGLKFDGTHYAKEGAVTGKVVMLPLVEKEKDENGESADEEGAADQVQVILGKKLAGMIADWLQNGKLVESEKRAIQPEDILVLVRRRSLLVQTLTNELKRHHIKVQGMDRVILNTHLAIQDMIAFGRWLTLPEDDYSLACILRSPIGNISEEALFALAYGRSHSLWAALNEKSQEGAYTQITTLLKSYLGKVDYKDPYQIFYQLLMKEQKIRNFTGRMGDEAASMLQEFLQQALEYQGKNPASMQGFIQFIEQNAFEIKRTGSLPKAVRIMTVHGAKGLEAPIVILADTADAGQPHEEITWLSEEAGLLPFCMPPKEFHDARMAQHCEAIKQIRLEEYQRLLYVAISRPKDELYITGYRTRNSKYDQSWYATLDSALKDIAEYRPAIAALPDEPRGANTFSAQQPVSALPTFLLAPAPVPQTPSKMRKASQLLTFESDAALVKHENMPNAAKDYGILLHGVIEAAFHLTDGDVNVTHIEQAMAALPEHETQADRQALTKELAQLIQHESTAFLFKRAERLVETPMAGAIELQGRSERVAAKIDLCILGEKEAWLVDFKTSRQIPEKTHHIYVRQLALYQYFLARIFPQKTIHAALVWTVEPKFEQIPQSLLNAELLDAMQTAS